MKKLYRSNEKKFLGVCAGMAEYLEIDPVIVRLIWVWFAILGGCGVFLYLIFWFIMPTKAKY